MLAGTALGAPRACMSCQQLKAVDGGRWPTKRGGGGGRGWAVAGEKTEGEAICQL